MKEPVEFYMAVQAYEISHCFCFSKQPCIIIKTDEIPWTISLNYFFAAKDTIIYHVAITTVIFSCERSRNILLVVK